MKDLPLYRLFIYYCIHYIDFFIHPVKYIYFTNLRISITVLALNWRITLKQNLPEILHIAFLLIVTVSILFYILMMVHLLTIVFLSICIVYRHSCIVQHIRLLLRAVNMNQLMKNKDIISLQSMLSVTHV